MPKRNVFISYHHKGEQDIVERFCQTFSSDYEVFTDQSLERAAESDDVDYLNQVCRDAIDGTSVTIVMIGKHTGGRRFVDWEIRHTLFREHGLVAILRPNLASSAAMLPERLCDNLSKGTGYAKFYNYPSEAASLQRILEEACAAEKAKIDNSREKMKRNTAP